MLDLTEQFGALCGRILGDLGADVLKIERPGGDPARRLPPFADGRPGPNGSLSWWASNYNKRSAVLDLATADGRAVLTALAAASDFVIESFPPGRLAEMDLDYAHLRRINPSLVWVSITPYGSDGPRAGWAADDITLNGRRRLDAPRRQRRPGAAAMLGAPGRPSGRGRRRRWAPWSRTTIGV